MTFVAAFHFLSSVEFDVTDGLDCGALVPVGAKLAVIELHKLGGLMAFPLPNNRMVPQFRALWVLQVERHGLALAQLHE